MPKDQVPYSLIAYLTQQRDMLQRKKGSKHDPRLPEMNVLIENLELLITFAEESYYSRIEKLYPSYTNHGKHHIEQVHQMIAQLLAPKRADIHYFDLFILTMAIFFHDTGMIKSREKHGEEVSSIINGLRAFLPKVAFGQIISQIAEAHTGDFEKLEQLSTSWPISFTTSASIDARALASLLRFADEVSETSGSIDDNFSNVPEDQQIFWEYAYCIKSVTPNVKDRCIEIKIRIRNLTCFKEFSVPRKDGTIDKLQFFDYLLERLDKMDRERRNCCANFRYLVSIDSINVDIRFVDERNIEIPGVRPVFISLCEKYCDRNSFVDAFYNHNPDIKDRGTFMSMLNVGAK